MCDCLAAICVPHICTSAGSVASKKMDEIVGKGGLDDVAKARGITDRYDEGPGTAYVVLLGLASLGLTVGWHEVGPTQGGWMNCQGQGDQ